jgi:hypothetical protein
MTGFAVTGCPNGPWPERSDDRFAVSGRTRTAAGAPR